MKKTRFTIAFVYNVRHTYPNPDDPHTQLEADFDDPDTIQKVVEYLKKQFTVIPIEGNEKAYEILSKKRNVIDIVFNFSEGIYGKDRYCHVPAFLEMLQIPYTGSRPLTQALVLNKPKMKDVLRAYRIPTPPSQVFTTGKERFLRSLRFPVIVKPSAQGSSAGITQESIVHTESQLHKQINHVISVFKQPALVEHFLRGPEFSVALLGNPPRILPIIQPDFSLLPKTYYPCDSLEVKWVLEEDPNLKTYLRCPAPISKLTKQKIERLATKTWHALGIYDWCRIDLKSDTNGKLYVLDVNSPAGLIPPEISKTSYFPLAARAAGIQYGKLLSIIISTALKRYGKI